MATKTAKFDIKTLQTEATKGLYAGAGVTDLAVEVVRDYVADVRTRFVDVQKDVTARAADVRKNVEDLDFEPKALRAQATKVVNERVDAFAKEAKARRDAIEKRVSELQSEVDDTYGDLVKRGESLVGRIRRQESTKATVKSAKTTVTKAKTTGTQTRTAAKKTADGAKKSATARKTAAKKASAPAKASAKATATAAKKTVSNAAKAVVDAAEKVGD